MSHAGVKVWLNRELRHDEPWAHSYPLGDGMVRVGTYANASMFDNLSVRAVTALPGKTWYVNGSVSQSGDGASWHSPLKTIQEGIEASVDGDTVIVAAGTYYQNIHFLAKNITLRSADPLDPAVVNATIINGRAYTSVVTLQGEENETCVLSGFTITNGKSPYGGGVLGHDARATIRHNVIFGNWGDVGGGLAFCNGPIQNNVIASNTANYTGGGLGGCGAAILRNVIFQNSATKWHGGLGMSSGPIRNNIIVGNTAPLAGGGLGVCDGPIENNVIVGNSTTYTGGGLSICLGTVRNNIIRGNKGQSGSQIWGDTKPTNCCIEGWTGGGEGNISVDPQFLDADGPDNNPDTFEDNDYRLRPSSSCVDAGKNQPWMWGAVDLDGNNRIFFGGKSKTVDMGAYERGSFRFNIVRFRRAAFNHVEIAWTSRPGDTYDIWSSEVFPTLLWWYEATVSSQGNLTTWTGSTTTVPRDFYKVELRGSAIVSHRPLL